MSEGSVERPHGDAVRTEKRTPRSICLSEPEWERIEAFAEKRGVAAAEFVRIAALAAIEDGTGEGVGPLAPLIERTFRYAHMVATHMRDGLLAAGRGQELEALIADARAFQDEVLAGGADRE